jgi:hypothetical protein
MRTDPTDTGGLFVRRRPGTAPVRYGAVPERAGERRRHADNAFALAIAALMVLINLCFWGPLPVAWLWVGSQVDYQTNSVSFGIFTAFAGLMATLVLGLAVLKRLDAAWILVRRAAGHDQRSGIIGPIFAVTAAVGATLFTLWLLFVGGLGPDLAPRSQ